jgi:ABC-type transport system involved in cytochrome c biogenesis permease subunit
MTNTKGSTYLLIVTTALIGLLIADAQRSYVFSAIVFVILTLIMAYALSMFMAEKE